VSIRCGGANPRRRSCRFAESSASCSFPSARWGRAFLTGQIDANTTFEKGDFRNIVPRFAKEAREANQSLVNLLATPAQLALSWLLAQEPWIVPIPGTTKAARMKENTDAADVELTAADLRRVNEALAQIKVVGDRHPAHLAARAGK